MEQELQLDNILYKVTAFRKELCIKIGRKQLIQRTEMKPYISRECFVHDGKKTRLNESRGKARVYL